MEATTAFNEEDSPRPLRSNHSSSLLRPWEPKGQSPSTALKYPSSKYKRLPPQTQHLIESKSREYISNNYNKNSPFPHRDIDIIL
ncbi:Hypothetical protein FKW44_005116 [Caligus rogercresseyi]|uniref:Uncharacterized protein n=1 Tax=Caligus rogercresseyi TaxID=217165 RepID=A0A7T8KBH9_CALRO|nr:Hypothetical protein FKW44_005116 [Caligus rogercresseyi]